MSFYRPYFFKCKNCGFMLSLLGQADKEILGECPSCEDGSLDYAPKKDREQYIKGLKLEILLMGDQEAGK